MCRSVTTRHRHRTMKTLKVLGLDVSKNNVTCCILTEYPSGGLLNHWNALSKKWKDNFPVFYAKAPMGKNGAPKKVQDAWEFIAYLEHHRPDMALLEPTGGHYSKIWVTILESLEINYRWIGHVELKRYRAGKKLQKNDASDALAHAAYYLDPEHWNQDGTENPDYYLQKMCPEILMLRDAIANLDHLNRQKNGFENYLTQRLSHEFPEIAKSKALSTLRWLAGQSDKVRGTERTKLNNAYKKSIAPSVNITLTDYTTFESEIVLRCHERIKDLEARISELVYTEPFKDYNDIFDGFDFGLKTRAVLLSRIFPFEAFLGSDLQEVIEYEVKQVKKKEKIHSKGVIQVSFEQGDVKRIRRNRSRDSFKMRLGYGSYFEFSGDGWVEVQGGSSAVRKATFLHVLTKVSPDGRLNDSLRNQKIINRKEEMREGQSRLTRHQQSKLCSKLINELYAEFKQRFTF